MRNPARPGPTRLGALRLGALLVGSLLLGGLVLAGGGGAAEGNRELCRQWSGSHGPEKASLADELGRRNALTKIRKLAEPEPGSGRSVYRTADIQRLCRLP